MDLMPPPVRKRTTHITLALGYLAAAALAVAGIWNALVEARVTVAAPPGPHPGEPVSVAMRSHYAWFATIVGQERGVLVAAIIGVVGLVLVVDVVRRTATTAATGRTSVLTRTGGAAVVLGSLVWVVGAVVTLGGHRAVGLMATHHNPIQTVNAISFTVDVTADAFSATGFALLGAGLVALGFAHSADPRRSGLALLTGAAALAVAAGYAAGISALTTWLLAALAVVLLPAWLVRTARALVEA
jgi:hypothetical protein